MKDWFYLPWSEIVSKSSGTTKGQIVNKIKRGFYSINEIEDELNITFASNELADVNYLLRIYSPLSYENQSGCKGCDGCGGKTSGCKV
jgi:hypothetical protein